MQKAYDAHKATPEYAQWLKDMDEKADDHYIRGDRDPEGYEVYMAALQDKKHFFNFVRDTAGANRGKADLQVKALSFFLACDEFDSALAAATCLAEQHLAHVKTPRALSKFESYLEKLHDEQAQTSAKRLDEAAKFIAEPLSTFKAERLAIELDEGFKERMEFAHERVKLGQDYEMAVIVLDMDT